MPDAPLPRSPERPARADRGAQWDRIVRSARLILPVIAGVLAAIFIIAPMFKRNEVSFVLAKDTVDKAPERMKLESAIYRGADGKGRAFALSAGSAVQQSSADTQVQLNALSGRIDLSQGPATIRATQGVYDIQRQMVDLPGQMAFASADGYKLNTSGVVLDLNSQDIRSRDRVSGDTPLGTFSGGMLTGNLDAQKVMLKGGVTGALSVGDYRADMMEVDNKAGTVVLQGRARLNIKQGVLTR